MSIFHGEDGFLGQPKVQETYKIINFWFLMENSILKIFGSLDVKITPWRLFLNQFSKADKELTVLIYILWIEGRKKGHVLQVHQNSNADVVCRCQFKHSCMTSSRHFSKSFFFIFTKFGAPPFFDRDHREVLIFFFNLLFTIFNWPIKLFFYFEHLYPFSICYLWSLCLYLDF